MNGLVQEQRRGVAPRPQLGVLFGCRTRVGMLWRDELESYS